MRAPAFPTAEENEIWPSLPFDAWKDTAATLHLWTQIVGKVRTELAPWANHSWNVTLYVTARGLTTSLMPHQSRCFEIDFDFIDHRVLIRASDGATREMPLQPMAVADFHARLLATLEEMGLPVKISGQPNEVDPAIPFAEDRQHTAYDSEAAHRFWRVLVQTDRVFKQFRARFIGKCSPVHFSGVVPTWR